MSEDEIANWCMTRACRKGGGHQPPQILADQLTLSQPGGHIIPTQYYKPPRIFRPCDGPDILREIQMLNTRDSRVAL